MQLILVVGRFSDPAVAYRPYDAMLRAARLPRAVELIAVLLPLEVRNVVAGLRPWEFQVWADFLPEYFENPNGHPICEIPAGNYCTVTNRLTDQHGDER